MVQGSIDSIAETDSDLSRENSIQKLSGSQEARNALLIDMKKSQTWIGTSLDI